MSRVVIDIETVGDDFESFSDYEKEYFLKYTQTEEEKEEKKLQTALSPLTGKVVSIGYYLIGEEKAFVETVSDKEENYEKEGYKYLFIKTEKEILQNFWRYIGKFSQVVTFNGRGFDIPFLMIRSAINKVEPSKNLMGQRFSFYPHCDLMDQMTFYGALRYPKSLHFFTKGFGIETPKGDMEGKEVTSYYNEGKHKEIGEYCLKDVLATAKLFDYWDKYLNVGK